jgi:hypothetical protein
MRAAIPPRQKKTGHNPHQSAISNLQSLAQHWEWLLYSTGGAIDFLNSSWFLMAWKWKNGTAKLATQTEALGDLSLAEGDK